MPAVLPPRLLSSIVSGNPVRPVIVVPCPKSPAAPGASITVNVGTTDEELKHYVLVYDADGLLIGSSKDKLKLLGGVGTGVLTDTINLVPPMQAGKTYYIRVYVFTAGEEVSHTITVTL